MKILTSDEIETNLNVLVVIFQDQWRIWQINLEQSSLAQYQTRESCLSNLGSLAQNPRLVGPVKHIRIASLRNDSQSWWTLVTGLNSYRECCRSWATFIIITLRISKFWWYNYPASLINIVKFAFLSPSISL